MATRPAHIQYLLLIVLFFVVQQWMVMAMIPPLTKRLGLLRKSLRDVDREDTVLPPGFKIFYYEQTLDHFGYTPQSYKTFQQRYVMSHEHWGGANTSSPIIVYTGDEEDIVPLVESTGQGFLSDLALHFKALLVYIEHRYYGESLPFGRKTFDNSSTLGYFSSTQALADYAQLITDLKKNLSAEHCPVIAVGGSYGGMLASWFRLKYPHIAYAALASSAPILYFDDITPHNGYPLTVSKDFKDISESCHNTIKQSWSKIDRVAARPGGLLKLSHLFSTCQPLHSSQELKDSIALFYEWAAQYDEPKENIIQSICNAIDKAKGGGILGRIAAGYNVSLGNLPGDYTCPNVSDIQSVPDPWTWQTCTEMVIPIGNGANDTMFEASPFDYKRFSEDCKAEFGVTPRRHWITTEFGGHNIKAVLRKFASNIIFSNGLRDPYSSGGVLEDISDSIVALNTKEGTHCVDISLPPTKSDPHWLVSQRKKEIKFIEKWLAEYK